MKSNVFVDMREQMNQLTLTVEKKYLVSIKNKAVVLVGLRFIEFGCWLCGMRLEENEP